MTDAPLLLTERLELWVPQCDDIAPMLAIVDDPETGRYLGRIATAADHFARFSRNAGSWLLYGYGSFVLRERASGEVIGNAGVFHSWRGLGREFDDCPEAGWILRSDRSGQGLAREAMEAALDWFARTQGPQRVFCMIDAANDRSIALATKLGFEAHGDAELPGGEAVRLFVRRRPDD